MHLHTLEKPSNEIKDGQIWEFVPTGVGNCPARWSLLLIIGFLFWSSSWRWQPHIGVCRLLWSLLSRAQWERLTEVGRDLSWPEPDFDGDIWTGKNLDGDIWTGKNLDWDIWTGKNFNWEIWTRKKTISTGKLWHNPLWLDKFRAHQETILSISSQV